MSDIEKIQLFESSTIRTAWVEEEEKWYFSVIDTVGVLAESKDPKQYIKKMRARDPELSAKWGTICTPVGMLAPAWSHLLMQKTNLLWKSGHHKLTTNKHRKGRVRRPFLMLERLERLQFFNVFLDVSKIHILCELIRCKDSDFSGISS